VSPTAEAAVDSIRLSGPAFHNDPYPTYARLRELPAPFFDVVSGTWLVSRFADVEALLRDPRISKRLQRASPTAFEQSVLFRDAPVHQRIRGLLNQGFASFGSTALDTLITRNATLLIENLKTKHHAEFIHDFALPLPLTVIGELLGVPLADMPYLHDLSSECMLGEDVAPEESIRRHFAATSTMERYYRDLIATHPRDGIIGFLLNLQGDTLSEDEIAGNCVVLTISGHETTVNLLGNGLYLLLEQRDRFERLQANPELLTSAIEETLRFECPAQRGTFRVVAEPVEISGQTIEPGSRITAMIGAANRDPEQFADPDHFDLARTNNRHLSFGVGPHRCIGAQLSRAEARIGFGLLLENLPSLKLATVPTGGGWLTRTLQRARGAAEEQPIPPQWRKTFLTRGLKELAVTY
jgi:cytochrome P450